MRVLDIESSEEGSRTMTTSAPVPTPGTLFTKPSTKEPALTKRDIQNLRKFYVENEKVTQELKPLLTTTGSHNEIV